MKTNGHQGVRTRRTGLVAGGLVVALVSGSAGAALAAGALHGRTVVSDAIAAMKAAGIMSNIDGSFKTDKPVLRKDLAVALHHGLPRISVDTAFSSVPSGSSSLDIAQAAMTVGGAAGRAQGVLVTVQMAVDHDANLTSDCIASFSVTDGTSTLETWDVEFYDIGFGEEESVAFSVLTAQSTATTVTYHVLATNPCSAELFTDEDVMTVQTVPLSGTGVGFPSRPAHRTEASRER